MKQFLSVACLSVLALVVMDSGQVIMCKGEQALAAELAPPPPPAPVGKGKAPIFIGKGKAPPATVVTK
jgi:hypothetical protein